MEGKYKYGTSQLFNFAQDSYLERTSRPIYAIVFLLPFIVFHELGTIFINTDVLNQSQIRVVAFVWLQQFLENIGFGSKFAWAAPALAVVIILTALQLASRKRWRFAVSDVWPMAVECILLAVPLIVLSLFLSSPAEPRSDIGRFSNSAMRFCCASSVRHDAKSRIRDVQYNNAVPSCSAVVEENLSTVATEDNSDSKSAIKLLADIVTSIGAGIYEELIFRLILICALMILFQNVLQLDRKNSIILSVLISAALFSAHHHIVFLNGQLTQSAPFNWPEFVFRTIAGIYFAVLFAIRGFGITAGTHAFYDIIAVFINAFLWLR